MSNFSKVVKTVFMSWAIFTGLICLSIQPTLAADLSNESCIDLSGKSFGDVTITTAEWHEINGGPICVVFAHRAPFLDMEVVLPSTWSGRYVQQGGGGLDGYIRTALVRNGESEVVGANEAVSRFRAIHASSNGGNREGVDGESAPTVWFSGNFDAEQSLMDYSYQSIKTTLDFARGLSESVYGKLPDVGYFNGCSNGGRNAYIAAQRWPEAFDGIVSGCEPMNMPGTTTAWLSLAGVKGTPAELSPAEYTFAYNAAVRACDADDGNEDGVIANPSACSFSPRELICEAVESFNCLSPDQAGTLEMLLTDIKDSQGKILSSRFYWADFGNFAPNFGAYGSVYGAIATDDLSWLQPEKQRQFNVEEHYYEIANGLLRSGLGHDRLAVAEFIASGKKLLHWHDGSDNLLSPSDHVRVFDEVMETAAIMARGSSIDVNDNSRLYIVPGTVHAGGAQTVNWIEAIIDWTENGNAPENLIHRRPDGTTIPVCRFPAYPMGVGDGYACSDLL